MTNIARYLFQPLMQKRNAEAAAALWQQCGGPDGLSLRLHSDPTQGLREVMVVIDRLVGSSGACFYVDC